MDRDTFLEAFGQYTSYTPGDIEAEADLQLDPDRAIESAPEGETSVSAGRTPWVTVNWDGSHGLPDVDFPILGDIQRQDWFGFNRMDEYQMRSSRYGTALVGEYLDNLPDFEPTAQQIVAKASEWGLDERYYDRLVEARSAEDMDVLAETYAMREQREMRIQESATGFTGFAARVGVNMFDPAFLATGGTAGTILKVGQGTTRLANAWRASAAGFAADAPLEVSRQALDPSVTWQQTAAAVMASTALSGALGSLGRGVDAAEVEALDRAAADVHNYFDQMQGSVGAAQRRPVLREIDDATGEVEAVGAPDRLEVRVPGTSWGIGVFGTPLNFLGRSLDSVTRDISSRLSWNPFTRADGKANNVQGQTAYEAQDRIYRAGGAFVREHRGAMANYFRAKGQLAPTGGVSTEQVQAFNKLVAQVMTGVRQSTDADVNRAAKVWSDFHADTLAYVKNEYYNGKGATAGEGRGLEEFAEIEHDPTYLMRAFSGDGFRRVQNTLGGNEGVAQSLASTILRSNQKWLAGLAEKWNAGRTGAPDATGRVAAPMTPEFMALRIARKYVQTVERLTNPALRGEGSPHRPVTKADRDAAREVARQTFNAGDEFGDNVEEAIDMVMDLLAPARKSSVESPRARSRMTLNLDAEKDAAILDMFDWDVERLGMTYRRQLSGFAGLLRSGFNSASELDRMIDQIGRNTSGKSAGRQKRAAKEQRMLRAMRDMILGRGEASQLTGDTYHFVMNQIRRLNFGNLMSNVGFLAVSELGGAMTRTGPLRLFRQLPAFRQYFKQAREGDPEAINNIYYLSDVVMGHGSQQLRSRLGGRVDRYEGDFEELIDPNSRIQERIDTFTRKQANLTGRMSGMAPLTEFMRMAVVTADAQDWVKAARQGKPIYSARRLAAMGVDEEMWGRISAQLRKMDNTRSPDTGKNVPEFDFSRWDDPEALNVFINAIDRNSRRMVLEGDLGHQALIMRRSPALQLLFQFLGFPLNAFSKHLGFAFNVHDTRVAAETLAMSLGGSIGFMARTAAQGQAISDPEERQAFMEERFTWEEMAKATFYYSAHASVLPNLIDLPLSLMDVAGVEGVEPIFSKSRASGLAGDPLMGNATRSRLYRMVRASGDLVTGQPMSEDDVQGFATAFAPLGTHVVTQAFLDRALEGLPEETEDD